MKKFCVVLVAIAASAVMAVPALSGAASKVKASNAKCPAQFKEKPPPAKIVLTCTLKPGSVKVQAMLSIKGDKLGGTIKIKGKSFKVKSAQVKVDSQQRRVYKTTYKGKSGKGSFLMQSPPGAPTAPALVKVSGTY